MDIPLWQVDAFASRPFAGNPAAVCPLERWLPDGVMQSIAAENNLSETAFFVRRADGDFDFAGSRPRPRWTSAGTRPSPPRGPSCDEIDPTRTRVVFHTGAGRSSSCARVTSSRWTCPPDPGSRWRPRRARPRARRHPVQPPFARAISSRCSITPKTFARSRRTWRPSRRSRASSPCRRRRRDRGRPRRGLRVALLRARQGRRGGPGDRLRARDARSLLGGASRKPKLRARQVSARGGELGCSLDTRDGAGERVVLTGRAVVVLRGTMHV